MSRRSGSSVSGGSGMRTVDEDADALAHGGYVVEKLIDERVVDGVKQYLCKWRGYSLMDATWEPVTFQVTAALLEDYQDARDEQESRYRDADLAGRRARLDAMHDCAEERDRERALAEARARREALGIVKEEPESPMRFVPPSPEWSPSHGAALNVPPSPTSTEAEPSSPGCEPGPSTSDPYAFFAERCVSPTGSSFILDRIEPRQQPCTSAAFADDREPSPSPSFGDDDAPPARARSPEPEFEPPEEEEETNGEAAEKPSRKRPASRSSSSSWSEYSDTDSLLLEFPIARAKILGIVKEKYSMVCKKSDGTLELLHLRTAELTYYQDFNAFYEEKRAEPGGNYPANCYLQWTPELEAALNPPKPEPEPELEQAETSPDADAEEPSE